MSRRLLWSLYCLFILYGATIPFEFTVDPGTVREHFQRVTLDPFISPATGRRVGIPDLVQNILFFVPFGVLGVLAADETRRGPGRILWVGLLGFACTVGIEAIQLFTLDRISSTSDVLWNTCGASLGALGATAVDRAWRAGVRAAARAGLTQNTASRPLVAATLLVALAAWEPFDVTLELGSLAPKAHALLRDVWQAGVFTDEGVAIVHYALFGLALCAWLKALGKPVVAWASLVGVAAAFGLESGQLFISSRMPGLEDALVRAAGALIGVGIWTVRLSFPAPRFWLLVTVLGVAAGAAIQQLSPFQVAPIYRPFGLMPFFADYAHTTFETLSHVIELVLLYAPLGFVWRRLAGSGGLGGLLGALVAALVIAWPIEYFQGWIVGRYPDLTDMAMSLAGAWVGVQVARAVAANPLSQPTSQTIG